MANSEYIDFNAFFRVIHFGFSHISLSNENITLLFDSVLYSRPFVCVKHEPWKTPGFKHDFEKVHYHILTRRCVRETTSWNDKQWNIFFEKVDELDGWTKVELCHNVTEQMAFLQMPGMQVIINRMDPFLNRDWDNIKADDIDKEIQKNYNILDTKSEKIDE